MNALRLERSLVWCDLRVIEAVWRREVMGYLRDRSQIFGGFSRTLLWLVILGFGLGATLREIEGYTYSQYILPGVMVLNVLFAAMQSAFALVYDRKHGLMRQVLVSPAPLFSVTLGKLAGGASVAVIQGSIPLLFAPLIGVPLSVAGVLTAWAVMFAMGFGLTGLGVVIATRMKGRKPRPRLPEDGLYVSGPQKAVRLDDRVLEDGAAALDLKAEAVLRAGKRKFVRLVRG